MTEFSPKFSAGQFGQWIAVFNKLTGEADHPEALHLLAQYNSIWAEPEQFIPIPDNNHNVPERGMLRALGYSVSNGDAKNFDTVRRQKLLVYMIENQFPPLHSREYRDKWGAPNTVQRVEQMISVLKKLAEKWDSGFKRNARAKSRWLEDAEFLTSYKAAHFA